MVRSPASQTRAATRPCDLRQAVSHVVRERQRVGSPIAQPAPEHLRPSHQGLRTLSGGGIDALPDLWQSI
jgi:hypothetical protein